MSRKDITDLMVVKAVSECKKSNSSSWPYEILSTLANENEKVCYRAMERCHGRGYLEYGVSLRTAWLSEKGRELMENEKDK